MILVVFCLIEVLPWSGGGWWLCPQADQGHRNFRVVETASGKVADLTEGVKDWTLLVCDKA